MQALCVTNTSLSAADSCLGRPAKAAAGRSGYGAEGELHGSVQNPWDKQTQQTESGQVQPFRSSAVIGSFVLAGAC